MVLEGATQAIRGRKWIGSVTNFECLFHRREAISGTTNSLKRTWRERSEGLSGNINVLSTYTVMNVFVYIRRQSPFSAVIRETSVPTEVWWMCRTGCNRCWEVAVDCSDLYKTYIAFLPRVSECGEEQPKESRNQKTERRAAEHHLWGVQRWHTYSHCNHRVSKHVHVCTGSAWDWAHQQFDKGGKGGRGPWLSLMNYFLLKNSGKGEWLISGDFTKLWRIFLIQ